MIVGPNSFDPYSETGPSDPSSQVHQANINQSYRISNTDNSTIRDTDPNYNYQESFRGSSRPVLNKDDSYQSSMALHTTPEEPEYDDDRFETPQNRKTLRGSVLDISEKSQKKQCLKCTIF